MKLRACSWDRAAAARCPELHDVCMMRTGSPLSMFATCPLTLLTRDTSASQLLSPPTASFCLDLSISVALLLDDPTGANMRCASENGGPELRCSLPQPRAVLMRANVCCVTLQMRGFRRVRQCQKSVACVDHKVRAVSIRQRFSGKTSKLGAREQDERAEKKAQKKHKQSTKASKTTNTQSAKNDTQNAQKHGGNHCGLCCWFLWLL